MSVQDREWLYVRPSPPRGIQRTSIQPPFRASPIHGGAIQEPLRTGNPSSFWLKKGRPFVTQSWATLCFFLSGMWKSWSVTQLREVTHQQSYCVATQCRLTNKNYAVWSIFKVLLKCCSTTAPTTRWGGIQSFFPQIICEPTMYANYMCWDDTVHCMQLNKLGNFSFVS